MSTTEKKAPEAAIQGSLSQLYALTLQAERTLSEFFANDGKPFPFEVRKRLDAQPLDTVDGLLRRYAICHAARVGMAAEDARHRSGADASASATELIRRKPKIIHLTTGDRVAIRTKSVSAYEAMRMDWFMWVEMGKKADLLMERFRLSLYSDLQLLQRERRRVLLDLMARALSEEANPPGYSDATPEIRRLAASCADLDIIAVWEAHMEVGLGRLAHLLAGQSTQDTAEPSVSGFGALVAGLAKSERLTLSDIEDVDVYQLLAKRIVTSEQMDEDEREAFTGSLM